MNRAALSLVLIAALALGATAGCGDPAGPEDSAPPAEQRSEPAPRERRSAASSSDSPADAARTEERAKAAVVRAEELLDRVDEQIVAGKVKDAGRAPLLISRAKIRIDRGRFQEAGELAEEASTQLEKLLPEDSAPPAPQRQARTKARPRRSEPVPSEPPARETRPAEVAAAPPPSPPPPRAAPPPPRPTPTPAPFAPAPGPDGDTLRALDSTLVAYQRAFEACDTGRLQALWRMSETQIAAYQDICARGRPVVRAESMSAAKVAGDVALLCMDYHVAVDTGDSRISLKKRGPYTGEFLQRPDGWQISAIHTGCSRSLASSGKRPAPVYAAAEPPVPRAAREPAGPSAAGVLERFATLESPRLVTGGEDFAVQVALTVSQITQDVTVLDGQGSQPGMVQIDPPAQSDPRASPGGTQPGSGWAVDIVLSATGFDFPGGTNMGRIHVPRIGDSDTALFLMRAPERASSPVPLYATFWHDGVFLGRAMSKIRLEQGGPH